MTEKSKAAPCDKLLKILEAIKNMPEFKVTQWSNSGAVICKALQILFITYVKMRLNKEIVKETTIAAMILLLEKLPQFADVLGKLNIIELVRGLKEPQSKDSICLAKGDGFERRIAIEPDSHKRFYHRIAIVGVAENKTPMQEILTELSVYLSSLPGILILDPSEGCLNQIVTGGSRRMVYRDPCDSHGGKYLCLLSVVLVRKFPALAPYNKQIEKAFEQHDFIEYVKLFGQLAQNSPEAVLLGLSDLVFQRGSVCSVLSKDDKYNIDQLAALPKEYLSSWTTMVVRQQRLFDGPRQTTVCLHNASDYLQVSNRDKNEIEAVYDSISRLSNILSIFGIATKNNADVVINISSHDIINVDCADKGNAVRNCYKYVIPTLTAIFKDKQVNLFLSDDPMRRYEDYDI